MSSPVASKRSSSSPFDVPLSINELARLPRMPALLLLCPCPWPVFLRISLFRTMIGVSANGNAILVGLRISGGFSASLSGRYSFDFPVCFVSGFWALRVVSCINTGATCGSSACDGSPESRADLRRFSGGLCARVDFSINWRFRLPVIGAVAGAGADAFSADVVSSCFAVGAAVTFFDRVRAN